jgi:hypothetical protein
MQNKEPVYFLVVSSAVLVLLIGITTESVALRQEARRNFDFVSNNQLPVEPR